MSFVISASVCCARTVSIACCAVSTVLSNATWIFAPTGHFGTAVLDRDGRVLYNAPGSVTMELLEELYVSSKK